MTRLVTIVVLAALAGCATQAQKSGSDEQTRADIQNPTIMDCLTCHH